MDALGRVCSNWLEAGWRPHVDGGRLKPSALCLNNPHADGRRRVCSEPAQAMVVSA